MSAGLVCRSLGLRGLIPLTNRGESADRDLRRAPRCYQCDQIDLGVVALGLVLVGVSIAVPPISVFFEYLATFSFIFALAFTIIRHPEG